VIAQPLPVFIHGDNVGGLGALARCPQGVDQRGRGLGISCWIPVHRRRTRSRVPRQIVKIITAGVHSAVVDTHLFAERLDDVISVKIFLAQCAAIRDGDHQCIGVRAVIERPWIPQHQFVGSVMIRMPQRIARTQQRAILTLIDLNTLPDTHGGGNAGQHLGVHSRKGCPV
jgi:hypothetical protein